MIILTFHYFHISDSNLKGYIGLTDKGWQNSSSIVEWFKRVMIPKITSMPKELLPILLLVDGAHCHKTEEFMNLCSENQVILAILYPNATHALQPCDVGLMKPLKDMYKAELGEKKNIKLKDAVEAVAAVTEKMRSRPELIRNAFEAPGWFPFDENKVRRKLN
jgi:hypothetical protein